MKTLDSKPSLYIRWQPRYAPNIAVLHVTVAHVIVPQVTFAVQDDAHVTVAGED